MYQSFVLAFFFLVKQLSIQPNIIEKNWNQIFAYKLDVQNGNFLCSDDPLHRKITYAT